jgi:hypothetical protein
MVIFPHNFIDWLPIMIYNYVMGSFLYYERRELMPEILEDKNYWHPAFYGAAELEFRDNKGDLEFQREYNLSKEPLRIDLLVVKKIGGAKIKNEIGRIFKKHNILEYKSPGDGMSIDDYFKGLSYACLYKSLGESVDERQVDEITVSLFREERPEKMFESLKGLGATIEEKFHGIYYVKGIIVFDTQIIVTKELDMETHSSLRILSRNAKEEDARHFLGETESFDTKGDKENAEAILQVSVSANRELYKKLKEEFDMCQALQELMKDEIDEKLKESDLKKTEELTKSLMESLNIGLEEAMDKLKLSENDRKELRNRICVD